jgi:hypothetical protein
LGGVDGISAVPGLDLSSEENDGSVCDTQMTTAAQGYLQVDQDEKLSQKLVIKEYGYLSSGHLLVYVNGE